MPIPRHYLSIESREVLKAIKLIFKERKYKIIDEFENRFLRYIGTKYAIAVSSARIALYLILKALSIEKGKEVILSTYTDIIVPSVISAVGAKPVFVDIDEDTYNINPNKIEEKINKKTSAILPIHLYGNPCDMDEIMKIAKEHDLYVIEDAAHALGAEYKGRKVGSIGDVGYFSFSIGKNITTGGGGMITTDDTELVSKIKKEVEKYPLNISRCFKNLSFTFVTKIATSKLIFDFFTYPIIYILNEFNYPLIEKLFKRDQFKPSKYKTRFTAIQAAIGIEQLKKIDELNNKRRDNAQFLMKMLRNLEVKVPKETNKGKHVFLKYTIRIKDRDRIRKMLIRKGIDTSVDYNYTCSQLFKIRESYPIAQKVSKEVLNLPVNPNIGKKEMLGIYHSLKSVLNLS
jgi:dTDP-4-amino-4,6-dideoxygalactose transaminase